MDSLPNDNTYWVHPGRLMAGEYPGNQNGEIARSRLRKYLDAGVTCFVDLTYEGESGLLPYEPILRDVASELDRQIEYTRLPIIDQGVPSVDHMTRILDSIDDAVARGHTVYVHCWGGVGRTGTTVATYLIRHGRAADEALAQLAAWWSTVEKRNRHRRSPENDLQESFVRAWKH